MNSQNSATECQNCGKKLQNWRRTQVAFAIKQMHTTTYNPRNKWSTKHGSVSEPRSGTWFFIDRITRNHPSVSTSWSATSTVWNQTMFNFKWGSYDGESFARKVDLVYEKIVFWKKNLFLLPKGAAGKSYIRETTRLVNAFVEDSPLKNISIKAVMIMPALLLQKPTKKSKSRDHKSALERRMQNWEDGDILELLKECQTIQDPR